MKQRCPVGTAGVSAGDMLMKTVQGLLRSKRNIFILIAAVIAIAIFILIASLRDEPSREIDSPYGPKAIEPSSLKTGIYSVFENDRETPEITSDDELEF